ncbi:MAG: sulfurtransferase [Anaerolineales bacterium]|nr:sulfurtransferase [Anaerolineales bacterium]
MTHTTLLDTATLAAHLDDPDWVVLDCRFDLANTSWGEAEYAAAHLPGAACAHLDRDLSGPLTGANGRHPLPDPAALAARLGQWGIGPRTQVVAYDQDTGMYAARLWWLLRWLGHPAVAVLAGGWAQWQREARPTTTAVPRRAPADFTPRPQPRLAAEAAEVGRLRADPTYRLIDVRVFERFRGEWEPLDPVAGHIPGAVNFSIKQAFTPAAAWLPPVELRAKLLARLGGVPPERAVLYCGSGVTAAQGVLAFEHAGLPGARIYPGSWSEWIADPAHPIATGGE